MALALGLAVTATSAHASISRIGVQPGRPDSGNYIIHQAAGTEYASFPRAMSMDVPSGLNNIKKVLAAGQKNSDGGGESGYQRISTNGGITFAAATNMPVSYTSAIKRRNGSLLSLPFNPGVGPFTYYTSTNNGDSWNSVTGGTSDISVVWHRGMIEENNGDLYAVGYAGNFIKLMKSTNGGAAWFDSNTIATSGGGIAYSEPCIERCANGDWLVVIRTEGQSLRYSRSTNQGVNWTTPVAVPGAISTSGVDPSLYLMPNGILVLSYGEGTTATGRNVKLAFSADGNGTNWTNAVQTFTGNPNVSESTGYTGVWPMSAHRFIQMSDHGTGWSYPSAHPSPNPFYTWGRIVEIERVRTNRIDLKSIYAAVGASMITSDMTYSNASHPEARLAGAIDGSTDYWSGAFKAVGPGSYTINLQKSYKINAIGICMQYNVPQSATIELAAAAGGPWTAVKTYTALTHRTLDYTDIAPLAAQYVRVTVSGTGLLSLNEIEVYSTTETFENSLTEVIQAHGPLPTGYVSAGTSATQYGFAVRESTANAGYQSLRSFQMWDGSSTWSAGVKKIGAGAQTKTLEFRIKPQNYHASTGFIGFAIRGTVSGVEGLAFYLRVYNNGSIQYTKNGSTWLSTTGTGSPAGVNTVPLNTWRLIRLEASNTTDSATLYVDGLPKGNVEMFGTPANISNLTGFSLGSSGTANFNDTALFDDITIN